MAPPISILILTLNEEKDLPGALESVLWSDDIHVFDSCSTDKTVEIAERYGAIMTARPFSQFNNHAAHQNWALENIPFKYPWVLYIDADERVTPELRQSCEDAVATPGDVVAFRIQRRDYFMDTWLKHVQTSPFYMRLFRPDKMRYERFVNAVPMPDGPVGQITGYLDHFPFSKGLTRWFDRHNSYSTFEAKQILLNRAENKPFSLKIALFGRDFHEKRFHQKDLFYRLPCRPIIKFLLLYVVKRGFLDGRAGLTFAVLQSIYEQMIVYKTRELEDLQKVDQAKTTGAPA